MSLMMRMLATARAVGPTNDPYFSSVSSLLHFDGSNGSTTFTDQTSKSWTNVGASLSTSGPKFGTASLSLSGASTRISTPNVAGFQVGSGDFTIECWIKPTSLGAANTVFWNGNDGNYYSCIYAVVSTGGNITCGIYDAAAGSDQLNATSVISTGTWQHLALCRSAGTLRLFVGGVLVASVASTRDMGVPSSSPVLSIGATYGASYNQNYFIGNIDDFRFTKGVARYSSGFTPPASAFPDA